MALQASQKWPSSAGKLQKMVIPALSIMMLVTVSNLFMHTCAWKLEGSKNYREALSKSILFFEGQRSGKLPSNQRITWRRDSALQDGLLQNVDLVGGYYDAGDGVKFSFPMAFATTMLSWGVVEYGAQMDSAGELENALAAIRWATDYLLKTTSKPGVIYAQVGDPNSDHACWERAEDMDTPRSVFWVDASKPGSDLAGEIAAALAASSLAFKAYDLSYSDILLTRATRVFQFAEAYRGCYSNAFSNAVCPYYCSYSGYEDELLWGAAWMYKATREQEYMEFVVNNRQQIAERSPPFSWDDKHAGIHVLLSEIFLNEASNSENGLANYELEGFKDLADNFICSILPSSTQYSQQASTSTTPGGLVFVRDDENLQYATSTAFLLFTYGKHLSKASSTVSCHSHASSFHPHLLWQFAKHQVDYILGDNPMGMSYMVGYGAKYPRRIHHRGSSLPCMSSHPEHISCKDGFEYLSSGQANPNLLIGAVSGGPDNFDKYADDRSNYEQSEPALYINAPLVGALAYLTGISS
ncbi:hypothetical protein L7F22_018600 [Adiantum nelumboides]|nr:hypothetical protein [Adiantum nelumboides]